MPTPRLLRPALHVLLGIAALGLLTTALTGMTSAQEGEKAKDQQERLREGTVITDQVGVFKIRGDRAEFYPEGAEKGYGGLENLNLARICTIVSESPEEMQWVVTGLITEYNGTNYLLVTRAVRKTNTFKPRTQARFGAPRSPASETSPATDTSAALDVR